MRKRYKRKHHSCPFCKPYKMGLDHRWKAKELALLREFEKAKRGVI